MTNIGLLGFEHSVNYTWPSQDETNITTNKQKTITVQTTCPSVGTLKACACLFHFPHNIFISQYLFGKSQKIYDR